MNHKALEIFQQMTKSLYSNALLNGTPLAFKILNQEIMAIGLPMEPQDYTGLGLWTRD